MGNTEQGNKGTSPAKRADKIGLARIVSKIKRQLEESKARKQEENPADRAAQRTANATVALAWIALVALVAAALTGYFIYQQYTAMEEANESTGFAANKARFDARANDVNTAKQLSVLQEQLTQQTESLRMDQRPWLKFETEGEKPPGIDPNNSKTRILPLTVGQPLKVQMKVTNIGKTTAENLLGTLVVELVPKDHEPAFPKTGKIQFHEGVRCTADGVKTLAATGWREGYLYPTEVSENSFSRMHCDKNGVAETDPLTQAEKNAIDGSQSYVLIFGEVWYADIFGVRHWTKFCEMANAQINAKVAEKCFRFDAVDNTQSKDKPK